MDRLTRSVVAKYKAKKTVKTQDGDETTVYVYSERQIALRNKKKAERLEKLRGRIADLEKQVKKDLKSSDPEKFLPALAVGLMNATFERIGNEESAKDGHFGVTGWQKDHISFGKGKATISYVGKSGVKQKKTVTDTGLVRALRDAYEACDDCLFHYDGGKVTAAKVNAYLKQFGGITAKDIRGYHANREIKERLEKIRSKGGALPEDKKEREAKLKKEFKKALEETAKAVGHEPSTLQRQYLIPGLEDCYLKDGTVPKKMTPKKAAVDYLNRKAIEKLRKDFLLLMKNIPHVKAQMAEDWSWSIYQEFRQVAKAYWVNFHTVLFDRFLNKALKYDEGISESDAKALDRALRPAAWDFYIALADLPAKPRGISDLDTWERKARRAAQAFWKQAKTSLDWYEQRVSPSGVGMQAPDRMVLDGFQVDVENYSPDNAGELEMFREALRVYRRRAAQVMPWMMKYQLPMRIDFKGGLQLKGEYRRDHIWMNGLVFDDVKAVVKTLAHEMGHHLFKHLSSAAERFWESAILRDYGPLKIEEVLKVWPPGVRSVFDVIDSLVKKDPVLALQLDVLSLGHDNSKHLLDRADFEALLDRGERTVSVPKTPITGYAGKNPEEAFCEAVGLLVAYGPRAVHPQIRHWLEIVIPGTVKLAMIRRILSRLSAQ